MFESVKDNPDTKHETLPHVRSGSYTVRAAGPEADQTVAEHWRALWLEVGIPESELHEDSQERTLRCISDFRERLQYQTFVAVDSAGAIVGSASCQRWEAPFPRVAASPLLNLGTAWCIFVRPRHRRQGLGTRLVASCVEHWRAIGSSRGILMYASELGRRLYEKAGFVNGNVLMLDNVLGDSPWMEVAAKCNTTYEVR